jgi:exopolysaccharide biosynthesis polyprenyl glycosylphosphotransferase
MPVAEWAKWQPRISERRLVLMAGDLLAVVGAVTFALGAWSFAAEEPLDVAFILPRSYWYPVLAILWFILASVNDFYDLNLAAQRVASVQRLLLITFQLGVVYLIVFFVADQVALPRLFILYFAVALFVLVSVWRLVNPALIGWASAPRRVLIIGSDWAAATIIDVLKQDHSHPYEVCGIIAEPDSGVGEVGGVPVVGGGADIPRLVRDFRIVELIVTSTRELDGDVFQGMMDAYEVGTLIVPMPILYERLTGRVPVEHVNNSWAVVLPIERTTFYRLYSFLKRMTDLLLAVPGLLISALIMPLIMLLIWVESPGAVIYSQVRIGQHGRPFRLYKLRTMVHDAERTTGAVFAQSHDPRVTGLGRFLRRVRLDEVPQLFNVLRGDMSLVGPRPERPEHIARLQASIPFYRTRHVVKPGLTGWAQVRFHYAASDHDALLKLQYDLYYIRHQSMLLDAAILVRTVGKVLTLGGQ